MKKKYLLVLSLFVSLFLFAGCGKNDNELVGKWEGHTYAAEEEYQISTTFEFENGGKVTYINGYGTNATGKYTVSGNTVVIEVSAWDKPKEYKFKIEDNKLDLTAQDDYSPSYVGLEKK